jgi:hypothetical protein
MPLYRDAEPLVLRGFDVAKITDGVQFILQHPLVIRDTYTYTAVSGSKKTVLVLEKNEDKLTEIVESIEFRTWADKSGKYSLAGKFLGFKNNQVQLIRKDDRKEIEIPLKDLSTEDQKWVRAELKQRAEKKKAERKNQSIRKPSR